MSTGSSSMCSSYDTAAQPADDEAAIRQLIEAMTAAFNTRNEGATAALMTEDADFVNVLGSWSKGAAEIARARHARFATALKNPHHRRPNSVHPAGPGACARDPRDDRDAGCCRDGTPSTS
ncbi:MAG: YybH family protein [Candidatus Rokuibacteriota bacterium]